MRVSSRNRPRHRRKHQAAPTDHTNFNEFLGALEGCKVNAIAHPDQDGAEAYHQSIVALFQKAWAMVPSASTTAPGAPAQNQQTIPATSFTGLNAELLNKILTLPTSVSPQSDSGMRLQLLVNGVPGSLANAQTGDTITAIVPKSAASDSAEPASLSCSTIAISARFKSSASLPAKPYTPPPPTATNITVLEAKAVDQQWLRQKLNAAAQSLASINPWSAPQITGQYGTLQGVSNTSSYIAGQLSTAATPSYSVVSNNAPAPTTQTQYAAQCPSGYTPTAIATGNGVTCTANTGTTPISGNATVTSVQTNPATNSLQITQTIPSLTPSTPTAPTPVTQPALPTNTGLNPLDILAQQVQLNSELNMYQLLYNGAVSDNYSIGGNGEIDGVRRQMTLAFPVSISGFPPYKNALAEVRVIIVARRPSTSTSIVQSIPPSQGSMASEDRLSLINLFPQTRTYNVARVTTNTKQFGAGVAISALGVGINGGKSKSTLYLVKDTDTVALQEPAVIPPLDKDGHASLSDLFRTLSASGECNSAPWVGWTDELKALNYDLDNPLVFGWQFRPVLGAAYPDPGQRLVFAQIGLSGTDGSVRPRVFVQTRWRQYDQQHQVAGPTYRNSCNWTELPNPSPNFGPPIVTNLSWSDAGGGNLLLAAQGTFFDPNLQVRIGTTQRALDFVSGDGKILQLQAPAAAIIQAPALSLVGTSNTLTSFINNTVNRLPNRSSEILANTAGTTNSTTAEAAPIAVPPPSSAPAHPPSAAAAPEAPAAAAVPVAADCTLNSASARSIPGPDGNSLISVQLTFGKYRSTDEITHTSLVLLGTDVYGYGLTNHPYLHESDPKTDGSKTSDATVQFIAKTDTINSNPALVVRDLAWTPSPLIIPIVVGPTFASFESLTAAPPATSDKTVPKLPKKPIVKRAAESPQRVAGPTWYRITGTGLLQMKDCMAEVAAAEAAKPKTQPPSCLAQVAGDYSQSTSILSNFTIEDDATAYIGLAKALDADSPLRLVWTDPVTSIAREWDVAAKATTKATAPGTITSNPVGLKKGDSLAVVFTGQDFTATSTVVFESTSLAVLAKDKTSVTVLIPTSVTSTPGIKTLVVTPSTGKPTYLQIAVANIK
jgi:hypothetical protein